jgi:hypothetical protein
MATAAMKNHDFAPYGARIIPWSVSTNIAPLTGLYGAALGMLGNQGARLSVNIKPGVCLDAGPVPYYPKSRRALILRTTPRGHA